MQKSDSPEKRTADLTVAVATLDRPDDLACCLEAILSNSVLPAELIVVDQSLSQSTRLVVEGISKQPFPVIYVHQQRRGLSVSRNTAIKQASQSIIAFTDDDVFLPLTLYHADYVGSGGNCGYDGSFGGYVYKWQCDDLVLYYYQNTQSFSLDIDPDGYSVIAYDFTPVDLANRDLYIVYPNARIGNPNPGWTAQKIDGATVYDVETGALAAISLRDDGIGFISYLQKEAYEIDDLKIAFQTFRVMLPVVSKP